MNIYLVITSDTGYETYDNGVVIAKDAVEAKEVWDKRTYHQTKVKKITKVGKASPSEKAQVLCASFNAG